MQWVDRIKQVKIVLVVMAVIIALLSLSVSHYLVRDLSREEEQKMEVWAEAMRSLSNASVDTDLNLVLTVINGNNTIPVVVVDYDGVVQTYRNLEIPASQDTLQFLQHAVNRMKTSKEPIRILLDESNPNDYPFPQGQEQENCKNRFASAYGGPYANPFKGKRMGEGFVFCSCLVLLCNRSCKAADGGKDKGEQPQGGGDNDSIGCLQLNACPGLLPQQA